MRHLAFILLASFARGGDASTRLNLAGVSVVVPSEMSADHVTRHGVHESTIEADIGGRYYIVSYGWWSSLLSRGPRTAREYLDGIGGYQYQDFRVIEPLKDGSFQGLPSWTVTHAYSVGMPTRGIPRQAYVRKTLAVQRQHGYLIIQYSNAEPFYKSGLSEFDSFLAGVTIGPMPPFSPLSALATLSLMLIIGAYCMWRRYKRV